MEVSSDINKIADRFSALANPQRIVIVRFLLAAFKLGGTTVGSIQRELQIPASTLNHHLERLRLAGIVECRRQSQKILCAVNLDALREMQDFLYQECCSRTEADELQEISAAAAARPGRSAAGQAIQSTKAES